MKIKFDEKDRITLCKKCARDFYNTGSFDIRRDNKSHEIGCCCYCNSPKGVDYFVKAKKQF